MKPTTIAPADPILDSQSIDAVYSGEDADWETSGEAGGILVEDGDYVSVPGTTTIIFDGATFLVTDNGDGSVTIEVIGGPGGADTPVDHGSMGATETIDAAAGTWHRGTLSADCTITVSGFTVDEGLVVLVNLTQDGTGGWGITWDADVVFAGDDQPAQAAGAVTWYVLWSDAGDGTVYGAVVGGATAIALDDLTDVNAPTPADGDVLTFDDYLQEWIAAAPTGGETPATTVESETTFGLSAAVGTDTEYARQDHTHGTPAEPTSVAALEALGVRGELVVADSGTGTGGLVPADISEMETERSTTSASLEDITGSTLDITLHRPCRINVTMAFSCYTVSGAAPSTIGFSVNIDGTDHDEMQRYLSGTADRGIGVVAHLSEELAPGTYTVKGRFRRVSGAATPGTDHVSLVATATGLDGPVLVTTDDGTDYVYADLGA